MFKETYVKDKAKQDQVYGHHDNMASSKWNTETTILFFIFICVCVFFGNTKDAN